MNNYIPNKRNQYQFRMKRKKVFRKIAVSKITIAEVETALMDLKMSRSEGT